jgi:hypothetical protein
MHAFQIFSAQTLPVSSFGPHKQCHENAYAARLELENILEGRMTRRVYVMEKARNYVSPAVRNEGQLTEIRNSLCVGRWPEP